MNKDDMTDAMLAGMEAGSAIFANPMMKLSALSQVMANFAAVAKVAHEIECDLGAARTGEQCLQLLRIRDTAMEHIEALMQQIKNEPTP